MFYPKKLFTTSNLSAQEKFIKYHEKSGNMVSEKESDNSPKTKVKVAEYCNLTDGEPKIIAIKKSQEEPNKS